jgi:hypothetical protein
VLLGRQPCGDARDQSVPSENLFPAMPCAYAACAQTSALATVAASRTENFIYIKRHHQKDAISNLIGA